MRNQNIGAWRMDAPTEKQVQLVTDMSELLHKPMPHKMTKGACSDFISDNMTAYKAALKQLREVITENAIDAGCYP